VDFPAFAILEHLYRLNVADAVRRRPDAQFVVVQKGLTVILEGGNDEVTPREPGDMWT
jgi:hypothetical protein